MPKTEWGGAEEPTIIIKLITEKFNMRIEADSSIPYHINY